MVAINETDFLRQAFELYRQASRIQVALADMFQIDFDALQQEELSTQQEYNEPPF